jgi:cation diffusion facilitator family transporter
VSPQRRTALVSVIAASMLIALKLGAGIATGSLGLLSDALHSASDLVAALLTFFAIGVAARPADRGHQYGHGKAEHLVALAEGAILVVAALFIAWIAGSHLVGAAEPRVEPVWYAYVVLVIVIVVDATRATASYRVGRRYGSAALQANALHFASDLGGSLAVLVGLLLAGAGYPLGDSVAALIVAGLVLVAAARLMRRNVDVLMDRAPAGAHDSARAAIGAIEPPVDLRRLRLRHAGGRHFADVVIGVAPDAAVGQGHAAADAVEEAVERALPGSDVVVHVEPRQGDAALRERAHAAAAAVPDVREVHNVTVLHVGDRTEISLHLKLPGTLSLQEAHEVATRAERAIAEAVPGVGAVHTHLEPLGDAAAGRRARNAEHRARAGEVARIVLDVTGREPLETRFLRTDEGVIGFLTLALDPSLTLAQAHERASEVERRCREAWPALAELVVHTEP